MPLRLLVTKCLKMQFKSGTSLNDLLCIDSVQPVSLVTNLYFNDSHGQCYLALHPKIHIPLRMVRYETWTENK